MGPNGGDIFVRRVSESEFDAGSALTREYLPQAVAMVETVRRVLRRNPDSIWGIFERVPDSSGGDKLLGYVSFLLLTREGTQALVAGTLDTGNPPTESIVPPGTAPEVVYIWAIVAKRLGALAIPMISDAMGELYHGRPIYATAGTEGGLRLLEGFGYVPVVPEKRGLGALYRQGHAADPHAAPPRRSHRMTARYKIVVVSTADEFEKAMAVRNVFLTEQNCPYEEEFDGNDRTGTLLLGYVDGEPAATVRIRYFANFFKMERLAVLPRFRRTLIAREIVLAGVNFCRRKGYTKGYGHAQKRLLPFWLKFGYKVMPRNYPLVFSDHEYVELTYDFEPDPQALTMNSDPYVLIRPEGRWDEPGVLERSSKRTPTNPH
jgi:predicted GNAT family N-acyltransferase